MTNYFMNQMKHYEIILENSISFGRVCVYIKRGYTMSLGLHGVSYGKWGVWLGFGGEG